MSTAWSPTEVAKTLQWLQDNSHFNEKPASIVEFLGADYLNIESGVRAGVRQELISLFGEEVDPDRIAKVRWAMFTGAIGIGKTTMASIVLPYMVHWVLCLRDPQEYFGLLPGSRIAFMMMSTSEDQAKETLFGDVKARILRSPWFQNNYPFDADYTNQLRFEKDIWILPGGSQETAFEGYNILGGILDEADSHKITKAKNYGEEGWNTINSRIESRFNTKGFLLTVGQMKSASGFAAKKYKELCEDPENAHTVRMTIWESRGWDFPDYLNPDGTRNSFWYDTKRKSIVSRDAAALLGFPEHIMEIPNVYIKSFRSNPEKALRDLAGIPPVAGATFISRIDKVEDCFTKWVDRFGDVSPVSPETYMPKLADWFKHPTPMKRAVHLDIAYSGEGDAATIVMGYVDHITDSDDEIESSKPYIVIDCIIRVKAPPGREVMLSDLRGYVYELKRRGFKIVSVTMDGFQSTDTRQQFQKKRIPASYLSVDRSKLPYEDMRDAIYEDRLELPPYMTFLRTSDVDPINIALKEITELEDTGKKIDHPANGSKDVADGVAAVVSRLMGDRSYRRGLSSNSSARQEESSESIEALLNFGQTGSHSVNPSVGGSGMSAPLPPAFGEILYPLPKGLGY